MSINSHLCADCVQNDHLKKKIKTVGTKSKCTFCERKRVVMAVSKIAKIFDKKYRKFYIGGNFDVKHDPELDAQERMEGGDFPANIIAKTLGCESKIANKIAEYLHGKEQSNNLEGHACAFYDPNRRYGSGDGDYHHHYDLWWSFCRRTKYEKRFHDPDAKKYLVNIFRGIESIDLNGAFAMKEMTPLSSGTIFRARFTQDYNLAVDWVFNPLVALGPNPCPLDGGRLNASGIPVFYGSFKPQTSIAEIRPPVGAYTVVAKFELIEKLKVLDLSVFNSKPKFPDLLDPLFDRVFETYLRKKFIDYFHSEISQPISKEDGPIEYVPSQIVGEYLREAYSLDGIIFSSAQSERGDKNIAMFDVPNLIEGMCRPQSFTSNPTLSGKMKFKPLTLPKPKLRYVSAEIHKVESVNTTLISPLGDYSL